jgi:hypothetical protein
MPKKEYGMSKDAIMNQVVLDMIFLMLERNGINFEANAFENKLRIDIDLPVAVVRNSKGEITKIGIIENIVKK